MRNARVPDGPALGGVKRDDTSVLGVGTHTLNTKPTEKINTMGIHDLDKDSHPEVPPGRCIIKGIYLMETKSL